MFGEMYRGIFLLNDVRTVLLSGFFLYPVFMVRDCSLALFFRGCPIVDRSSVEGAGFRKPIFLTYESGPVVFLPTTVF
jgi:hypothetical protein